MALAPILCGIAPHRASGLIRLRGRNQRDRGLGGEWEKRELLLQVQADCGIVVAEVADGDVLADVQVEIAATSGGHEIPSNSRPMSQWPNS
jgi:hypothetical protein